MLQPATPLRGRSPPRHPLTRCIRNVRARRQTLRGTASGYPEKAGPCATPRTFRARSRVAQPLQSRRSRAILQRGRSHEAAWIELRPRPEAPQPFRRQGRAAQSRDVYIPRYQSSMRVWHDAKCKAIRNRGADRSNHGSQHLRITSSLRSPPPFHCAHELRTCHGPRRTRCHRSVRWRRPARSR